MHDIRTLATVDGLDETVLDIKQLENNFGPSQTDFDSCMSS